MADGADVVALITEWDAFRATFAGVICVSFEKRWLEIHDAVQVEGALAKDVVDLDAGHLDGACA